MAIYHLSVKLISRSQGRSAVAAAAYRAGQRLRDDALGKVHNYSRKQGVFFQTILAPPGAPAWALDRGSLWNTVTARETRRDAQLAREVELALPTELTGQERIELVQLFVQEQFVDRGMVADVAIHHDNPANPHAHILLSMRTLGPDGFGLKNTAWNQKPLLFTWRREWASLCNQRLALAGHSARVDHRSNEAQGNPLQPTQKIGVASRRPDAQRAAGVGRDASVRAQDDGTERQAELPELMPMPVDPAAPNRGDAANRSEAAGSTGRTQDDGAGRRRKLEEPVRAPWADAKAKSRSRSDSRAQPGPKTAPKRPAGVYHTSGNPKDNRDIIKSRLAEHDRIVWENGEAIARHPEVALDLLTRHEATFTRASVATWVHARTMTPAQHAACMTAIFNCPDIVPLEVEAGMPRRWTSHDMLAVEKRLLVVADLMHRRRDNRVLAEYAASMPGFGALSAEQQRAVRYLSAETGDIGIIEGLAGSGKSTMLQCARLNWQTAGHRVWGTSLSGRAAENLELSAGIPARSLAAWEACWSRDLDVLDPGDIFVVDEASMLGTRQLELVAWRVAKAGAKLVLVGDSAQLQAIEAGAPLRALAARVGSVQLNTIRRQRDVWQQEASLALAQGHAAAALARYARAGHVHAQVTPEAAQKALLAAYFNAQRAFPKDTATILAYRRDEVAALNQLARQHLRDTGQLGPDRLVQTAQGQKAFAVGERVCCLRNNTVLGVSNGSLGTLEAIKHGSVVLRLDGVESRRLVIHLGDYNHLDYGYASTVHRAQGQTVDRSFVLASWAFDRHAAYVALTRHRTRADIFYPSTAFSSLGKLMVAFGRPRFKDLALDYQQAERANRALARALEPHQADRSVGKRSRGPTREQTPPAAPSALGTPSLTPDERQVLARERLELMKQLLAVQERAATPLIGLHEAFERHPAVQTSQQRLREAQKQMDYWNDETERLRRCAPPDQRTLELHRQRVTDPSTRETSTLGQAVLRSQVALEEAQQNVDRQKQDRALRAEALQFAQAQNDDSANARQVVNKTQARLKTIRQMFNSHSLALQNQSLPALDKDTKRGRD